MEFPLVKDKEEKKEKKGEKKGIEQIEGDKEQIEGDFFN